MKSLLQSLVARTQHTGEGEQTNQGGCPSSQFLSDKESFSFLKKKGGKPTAKPVKGSQAVSEAKAPPCQKQAEFLEASGASHP